MGLKIFCPDSNPIFFGEMVSGPSQIKFFDVYYTFEPAIGVQVQVGNPCDPNPQTPCPSECD